MTKKWAPVSIRSLTKSTTIKRRQHHAALGIKTIGGDNNRVKRQMSRIEK